MKTRLTKKDTDITCEQRLGREEQCILMFAYKFG